jgi:hypothetical protein
MEWEPVPGPEWEMVPERKRVSVREWAMFPSSGTGVEAGAIGGLGEGLGPPPC